MLCREVSERKFLILSKNKVENSYFILSEINSKLSTYKHTGPKFGILVQPKCFLWRPTRLNPNTQRVYLFLQWLQKTKLHFHLERSPGSSNVDRRVIYSWWVLLCTKEFKYTELSTSLHVWGACQFTQGFYRCQTAPFP